VIAEYGCAEVVFNDLVGLGIKHAAIHPVAARTFKPGLLQPFAKQAGFAPQAPRQRVLVIALKADQPGAERQGLGEQCDDAA
jgi:hypothetical protein